jgi:hypothetical protein
MKLRDYIQESLSKEYHYIVKIAKNCTTDDTAVMEKALEKYKFSNATEWKRLPIQENPMEFARLKGARFTSEVCSSTVTLGYPVNERILEVFLAVQMGIPYERVIVYPAKDPRVAEFDAAAERAANDVDRFPDPEEALLSEEDLSDSDENILLYGEDFNEAFLEELARVKAEKGADYFRVYPSKDNLMGQKHAGLIDDLMNTPNMGKEAAAGKEVDVISQSSRRN